MVPSNWRTIYSEITRPKPTPFLLSYWVSFTKPKSLNSLFLSYSGIPIPVSLTDILRYLSSLIFSMSMIIVTLPEVVNLSALDWSPRSTCITLYSSVLTMQLCNYDNSLSSSDILLYMTLNKMSLSSAFFLWMHITFSIDSLMSNIVIFFLNLPAFI